MWFGICLRYHYKMQNEGSSVLLTGMQTLLFLFSNFSVIYVGRASVHLTLPGHVSSGGNCVSLT